MRAHAVTVGISSIPVAPTLGREEIAARIPHSGSMCLLDEVIEWDAERIVCRSASHRAPDNPLRHCGDGGELAAICGIEYAAQAMAVHGGLVARNADRPRLGFLASVRNVEIHVARLDDLAADLVIEARRLSAASAPNDPAGDRSGGLASDSADSDGDACVLYAFAVRSAGRLLLEGRAAVVLDSDKLRR